MKKNILITLTLFLLSGCTPVEYDQSSISLLEKKLAETIVMGQTRIRLGYCPTMQKYIDMLVKRGNLEIVQFSSTQEVLENLKHKRIQVALIGRMPTKYEIDDNAKTQKLLKEERFTYISNTKIGISESQIPDYKNEVQLISWNDWQDHYELVVILDKNGNKVEKYRLPVLVF